MRADLIYGPVASRRHGRSLGINLGNPDRKVCSWGCLYCQCGLGKIGDRIPEPPTRSQVLQAVEAAIARESKALEAVTFAGNTESALHPEFPVIVQDLLALRARLGARWKLIFLSNGSELARPEIVSICDAIDETWVKLDCASTLLFRRVNLPISRVGGVTEHVDTIKKLARPRIQTLLWRDLSGRRLENFTPENLEGLLECYQRIRPVEVHVTTVARETALPGLAAVSQAELDEFAARISRAGISAAAFA